MSTPCINVDLEAATTAALVAANFGPVNIGTRGEAQTKPSADVAVVSGKFRISGNKLLQDHRILVEIVVKNLNDREKPRRAAMHPLVQCVVVLLHGKKFDLPIQPLDAGDWHELTSLEQLIKGLMQVEVEFSTTSEVPLPSDADNAADLEEILSSFHLVQANGTLTADPVAQDDFKRDS